MEPDSKAQAQQRADQIRAFQAEVARLEAEGVMQLSADMRLLSGFGPIYRVFGLLTVAAIKAGISS